MVLPYPVKPIHPSPVVKWNNGNLSATRQFVVPSENVDDFIEYLLDSGTGCGLPTTFPGWPRVFVDTIEANPISPCCFVTPGGLGYLENPATDLEGYPSVETGSNVGLDANETCWWKVVVGYTTREVIAGQSGVREGTWLSFNRNMSGELISIPTRNMKWASNNEPILADSHPTIFVPLADINVDWHFIDAADLCATEINLLTMQGTVNNAAYGSNFFPSACSNPWEAGTLLFLGYSVTTEIGTKSIFGSYCTAVETKKSLSMSFKMRRIYGFNGAAYGWNYDYYDTNKGTPGWDRVVDQFGNPKYKSTNFGNIFI